MKRTIYISEETFNELTKPKKKKTSHLNPDKWYEDKADFSISSSEGDLGYAHVVGGDAGMVCEEANDTDLHKYIESYLDFLEREGYDINPRPAIELNNEQQDDVMIRTGYYDPSQKRVVVFTNGRHPKDILRSFAHEMVHHMQNLRDEHKDWGTGGDLKDDEVLRNLEAEAYEVGNILFRMWTEELSHTKALNESTIREATEDDVDLSSFKVQMALNPKIWVNDLMDSRVRLKLLDIAQDFVEFLDVTWVKPEDTIVVGSIANYNWSRYSDIDLHVVIDYSKVDERKKFVENYFQSKKKEWNDTHDKISIFGFPVELYVQDKDADNASSAVYSIDKNKWLKKPSRSTFTKKDIDTLAIKKKASKIMTDIENIEDDDKESNDEYKNRKLYDKSSDLIDNITDTRKKSLSATKDEMNTDNLVFKVLRRNGYLDKLFKLRDKTYDKMNSLK